MTKDKLKENLKKLGVQLYELKEKEIGDEERMRELERVVMLRVIDQKWMDHIDDMDQMRQGIGLHAQKIGIEFDHIVLNRRRTSRKSDGVDAFGRKKNDSALRAGGYDIVKGNFDFAFADVEKFYIIMPVRRNRQEIVGAVRKKCLIGGSNWIDVFV